MVHLGKGDGTFYPAVNFATPAGQFETGTQHGDFNGDGAIDLAYPSTAGVTVVMNANDDRGQPGRGGRLPASPPRPRPPPARSCR